MSEDSSVQAPKRGGTAIWVTAIIVVGVLILAGIVAWAITASGGGTTPSTGAASPTQTERPTPTTTPPPTDATVPTCTVDQLAVSLGPSDGAAGSEYLPIVFTNTSSQTCLLEGYPGVSWVGDGNGTQLGTPADRDESVAIVDNTLAEGDTVQARLQVAQAGNFDDCQAATPDGLRIYPPHSTESVFVAFTEMEACGNAAVHQLLVQPVLPPS